jgi:hypothetical protein
MKLLNSYADGKIMDWIYTTSKKRKLCKLCYLRSKKKTFLTDSKDVVCEKCKREWFRFIALSLARRARGKISLQVVNIVVECILDSRMTVELFRDAFFEKHIYRKDRREQKKKEKGFSVESLKKKKITEGFSRQSLSITLEKKKSKKKKKKKVPGIIKSSTNILKYLGRKPKIDLPRRGARPARARPRRAPPRHRQASTPRRGARPARARPWRAPPRSRQASTPRRGPKIDLTTSQKEIVKPKIQRSMAPGSRPEIDLASIPTLSSRFIGLAPIAPAPAENRQTVKRLNLPHTKIKKISPLKRLDLFDDKDSDSDEEEEEVYDEYYGDAEVDDDDDGDTDYDEYYHRYLNVDEKLDDDDDENISLKLQSHPLEAKRDKVFFSAFAPSFVMEHFNIDITGYISRLRDQVLEEAKERGTEKEVGMKKQPLLISRGSSVTIVLEFHGDSLIVILDSKQKRVVWNGTSVSFFFFVKHTHTHTHTLKLDTREILL